VRHGATVQLMTGGKPRIGLVLGAGGCAGVAFHGGVLAAIEDATGWDPRRADIVVGTSAGSLTAGLLRRGLPATDLRAVSESRPLSAEAQGLAGVGQPHRPRLRRLDLLGVRPMADPAAVGRALLRPWRTTPAAVLSALLPEGPASTEPISSGFDEVGGGVWPEASLWVCAVGLGDGRRVVFGRPGAPPASLGGAVAASCAIPGLYRPVEIGGRRYVDGGVRSMHNLDLLVGAGLDAVIVSAPMTWAGKGLPWRPDAGLRHSFRVALRRQVERLQGEGTRVIVLAPDARMLEAMGLDPMDARHRATISRQAYRLGLDAVARDGIGAALAPAQPRRPAA
jgi:NTE family protein